MWKGNYRKLCIISMASLSLFYNEWMIVLFVNLFFNFVGALDFFKKKNYLLCIYEYTVAVIKHTRREHLIILYMIVNHHEVAGN